MKITSRASDYALLLIMYLAGLPQTEGSSVKKVSESQGISLRFLATITNKLTVARILVSQRGVGGGIRLARPAENITVRDVIEAIDGPIQTMFCQNTAELCFLEPHCRMKFFWDGIQNSVIDQLTHTTIKDLIGHGGKQEKPAETTYV